jgi:murein DD-endopeptidase MepM/ murein hydrolase activator NlpD
MNKRTRSRLEMAARALEFCQAQPDTSDGYTAAVAELASLLARSQQLTDLHRQGVAEVRAATERKRDLRRSIRQGQLVHVARAAQRAAREVPELAQKFALARQPVPYLTFRSLARTIAAEAEGRKELLVKHGLVDRVLQSLSAGLGQFDQAVAQGAEGRRIHVGAAVELDVVGGEAVAIVRVIDGLNRVRFAEDPDLLAAWRSASNVIGPARTGGRADGRTGSPSQTPPSGSEIKPAA